MATKVKVNKNHIIVDRYMQSIPYLHKTRHSNPLFKTSIYNVNEVIEEVGSTPGLLKLQQAVNKEMEDYNHLLKTFKYDEENFLYKHQQVGVAISKIRKRFGFFYATRTGKTPMILAILNDFLKDNPTQKWLILCPLILINTAWVNDIQEFFPHLNYINTYNKVGKKRIENIKKESNIYFANTEAFVRYYDYFKEKNFDGIVVDESSTMKSSRSQVGKAIVRLSQHVEYMYLLSGTPAPNGMYEYYRQLQALDFYSVPSSYTQFKREFFDDISYSDFEKLVIRADKKQELEDIIEKRAIYVDKKDVFEMSKSYTKLVTFEMPDELKAHYKTMAKKMYTEIKDETILAANAAVKVNKLRQISSGFLFNEDAEVHSISPYRFKVLQGLLKQIGDKQAIIFINYIEEVNQLKAILGDKAGYIYGGTSIVDKEESIAKFKAGKLKYLVANPISMSFGVTLTCCNIIIYFSLLFSYEAFAQSKDRIIGNITKQPLDTYYYILMAKDTVDEYIYTTLGNKQSASSNFLEVLKKEVTKYGYG